MNFENNGIITDNIISRETPPHLPQPPNDVVLIGSPQNNLISPSVAIPVSSSAAAAAASSTIGGAGGGGPGAGGLAPSHNQQSQQLQHKSNAADNVVQPTSDGSPAVVPEHPTATTNQWTEINQSPQKEYQQIVVPPNALGYLRHDNNMLYITENCVVIGRNSSTSSVHFHVAQNSFVSRKHFQVLFDTNTGDFYLSCLSKNGVFVDDVFQRKNSEPTKLPKMCTFRFPSTDIRIIFESFADSDGTIQAKQSLEPTSIDEKAIYSSPLQISIPKSEQKSPYPSPTGTISAANSCPTSPRHNFQDYSVPGNLFQPPSTSNYSNNEHEKPPYSYAQLIVQSIAAAPDKQLTLAGIYSFISKNYPYYRKEANKGWQNSIRHNLSLNRYFVKVARSQDEPGKGSFWRIDPVSETKLIDQSYKKRRQRSSQCFRPSYGMPSSAPVSPTHMGEYQDISRENSPLRDVVLHSAPGSPGTYDIPEYDEEICTLTEPINKRPKYSTEMNQ